MPEQPVDKDFLYGRFEAGEQRKRDRQDEREKLALQVARKSLDMADDEVEPMDIHANRTSINNGMGIKELVLVALLMAGSGVGGAGLVSMLRQTPKEVVTPTVADDREDKDTLFDLGFAEPKTVVSK